MRIWASLPDEGGCGHYRAIYPGEAVRLSGEADVAYAKQLPMTIHNGCVVDFPGELDCDVFVMGRPLRRLNYETIQVFQEKGVAVVVDIDDDFTCVDPRHMGWRHYQPKTSPESNREWLRMACNDADLVTCTTQALAGRYAPHGRVVVLPNLIPRAMLGVVPEAERDGRTVGWAGFVGTHPVDLRATRGGVAQAVAEAGARFLNVGDGRDVREQLSLGRDVELEVTGPVGFADYPHAVARFDVGIAPLDDTKFNAAKSALKGLEMAAVGVPFVASPTADYQRIARDGIGLLADSKAKKWKKATLELLRNRDELSAQMRAAVIEKHVLEDHAWRWLEAWELARKTRGGLRREAA